MISTRSLFSNLWVVLTLSIALLLPHSVDAAESSPSSKNISNNIALMPFLLGGQDARQEKKLEKTLDCQILGLCYLEEELLTGAEETLTSIYQKELKKILSDQVVPLALVKSASARLPRNDKNTPRELAIALGKELQASHVMVGLLWRFKEREGGPLTANTPASVAFSVYVVKIENSGLIWKASFDKTQTSLSENLLDAPLFMKKGMKWLSAEELATYGAAITMKDFPGIR